MCIRGIKVAEYHFCLERNKKTLHFIFYFYGKWKINSLASVLILCPNKESGCGPVNGETARHFFRKAAVLALHLKKKVTMIFHLASPSLPLFCQQVGGSPCVEGKWFYFFIQGCQSLVMDNLMALHSLKGI